MMRSFRSRIRFAASSKFWVALWAASLAGVRLGWAIDRSSRGPRRESPPAVPRHRAPPRVRYTIVNHRQCTLAVLAGRPDPDFTPTRAPVEPCRPPAASLARAHPTEPRGPQTGSPLAASVAALTGRRARRARRRQGKLRPLAVDRAVAIATPAARGQGRRAVRRSSVPCAKRWAVPDPPARSGQGSAGRPRMESVDDAAPAATAAPAGAIRPATPPAVRAGRSLRRHRLATGRSRRPTPDAPRPARGRPADHRNDRATANAPAWLFAVRKNSRPAPGPFRDDMTTIAAAASLTPSAAGRRRPAVPAWKAGRSLASASTVVPGRGCSSLPTTRVPRFSATAIGTISSFELPSRIAPSASHWLFAANSSCSSRLMP